MASRLLGCMVGSSLLVACGRSLPHSDTHLNRDDERDTSDAGAHSDTGRLSTSGSIVFHRYSDYEAWDSVLLMVELSDYSVTEISADWDIDHAMNALVAVHGLSDPQIGSQ